MRVAIVSNELPPYRIPLFRTLSKMSGIMLQVLFCSRREPNRLWDIPALDFGHIFLQERIFSYRGRYIHNNMGVLKRLWEFSPDVIVTGGFNPTHLYAFTYAKAMRIPHVVMTDGTDISEQNLSIVHKIVRKFIYRRSRSFIAASHGGLRLLRSYLVPPESCFTSCLCVDNAMFSPGPVENKFFDFLFCGRIEEIKNPLFALEVAIDTAKKLHRKTSIMFVGTGEQEDELKLRAAQQSMFVDAKFSGFLSHAELPRFYREARIFLFPTRGDPWGVVVNEACASGLPIITTPYAGVANELVIDEGNGYIELFDADTWSDRAAWLLSHPNEWQLFSYRSTELVAEYSYQNAAVGIVAACRHALSSDTPLALGMAERCE